MPLLVNEPELSMSILPFTPLKHVEHIGSHKRAYTSSLHTDFVWDQPNVSCDHISCENDNTFYDQNRSEIILVSRRRLADGLQHLVVASAQQSTYAIAPAELCMHGERRDYEGLQRVFELA